MKKMQLPRLNAEMILYGISIANALRLGFAYSYADAGGNILSMPGMFGLVMGAVVSVGTAFVAGKLGARLTKARTRLTWIAFVMLLVLEPVILAPITMTDMPTALTDTLGGRGGVMAWIWSAVLALVPSLVLAGTAIANGGLVEASAQRPQNAEAADASGESETKKPTAKRNANGKPLSKPQSEIPCRHAGAGCERTFQSQNAANAHARGCAFRPTVSMPVDLSGFGNVEGR